MTLKNLKALGYKVSLAFGDDDPETAVYYVEGFGLQTYLAANDTDALASLADPAAHAERVQQFENGPPTSEPNSQPGADQRVLEALEAVTIPNPKTATPEDLANAVNAIVEVVKQALAPPSK